MRAFVALTFLEIMSLLYLLNSMIFRASFLAYSELQYLSFTNVKFVFIGGGDEQNLPLGMCKKQDTWNSNDLIQQKRK